MVIQVKLKSILATATKWDGTNLKDFILMFGNASQNGNELSIYSESIENNVIVELDKYVLNLWGIPIVLTYAQLHNLCEDYPPFDENDSKPLRWIIDSFM